mmetsp:Transcript_3044/g.6690  ORF Transcript_3044/g.6690 Transcript_3044/m.6690 type:complete len:256 (+) Transcript_3044:487-1254(+)
MLRDHWSSSHARTITACSADVLRCSGCQHRIPASCSSSSSSSSKDLPANPNNRNNRNNHSNNNTNTNINNYDQEGGRTSNSLNSEDLLSSSSGAHEESSSVYTSSSTKKRNHSSSVPAWLWFIVGILVAVILFELWRRWIRLLCRRRKKQRKAQEPEEEPGSKDGKSSVLPVLLGGSSSSRIGAVIVEDKDSELVVHNLRVPRSITAENVLRDTIDSIEEGDLWWSRECELPSPLAGAQRSGGQECSKGCTAGCW